MTTLNECDKAPLLSKLAQAKQQRKNDLTSVIPWATVVISAGRV